MNYEKLTPEKFLERLKAGEYGSIAGARRGIGKSDWSEKDKERLRAVVEKHDFGNAPAVKAPKQAKKVGRPAAAAKQAKAPKPAKRLGRPPRAEKAAEETPKGASVHPTPVFVAPPEVNLQHAHAGVIAAFKMSTQPRTPLEEKAYEVSLRGYISAESAPQTTAPQKGVRQPRTPSTESALPAVTAAAATPTARIPVPVPVDAPPNGFANPEEQRAHEDVNAAARAAAATILGGS